MPAQADVPPLPGPRAPRVSVLLPNYNYARFLPAAIESVLTQTFSDFEFILSDDASTDDSARILRDYAARDPRIRCTLHARNLGMVENWNWCLQQARGDYVKFLFGDDVLVSPAALERLVTMLDREPRARIAASARVLLDERSRTTGIADELTDGLHDGPRLIARCLGLRRNLIGEPSTVLFRRRHAARGFDGTFRQIVDLEFWFHLLLRGDLIYTHEPLCAFRRHATQQTVANHRTVRPHLELLQLADRYLSIPQVQAHLPRGSLARRQLIFRQLHYTRKAVGRDPAFVAAIARLDLQLPTHWRILCWVLHRFSRPVENLARKLRSLHRRFLVSA